jgi:hypothetical protein
MTLVLFKHVFTYIAMLKQFLFWSLLFKESRPLGYGYALLIFFLLIRYFLSYACLLQFLLNLVPLKLHETKLF